MTTERTMRLEPDVWLAEIFGHPVFRVTNLPDAGDVFSWRSQVNGDAFLYARVPTSEVRLAHTITASGFRVVDVGLRLSREAGDRPARRALGVDVRSAERSDYVAICEIAGTAFKYSRFHLDPLVPSVIADRIKQAWMKSYERGTRGNDCLVAVDEGRVVGFVAIVESQRVQRVHTIDLIGVAPDAQGRGVGDALVRGFINRAAESAQLLEVGTQAANAPSVRLYEQCGFRMTEATYVLHAHVRAGEAV